MAYCARKKINAAWHFKFLRGFSKTPGDTREILL